MVGWHHRLDGGEFESTPGVGDGQGGLVCMIPVHGIAKIRTRLSDRTELNHTPWLSYWPHHMSRAHFHPLMYSIHVC